MKRFYTIISAMILSFCFLAADSLVPPDFPGYLQAGKSLKPGTLLRVIINSETKMNYTSSSSDDTRVSLRFTGGEGDGIFNFLPDGSSQNQAKASSEEESSLQTRIAARVVQLDETGGFLLRGSREIRIDKGVQRIQVEGWGTLDSLDENGLIPFDSLTDSVLTFSSFAQGDPVLSPTDLVQPAPQAPAPAPGGNVPAATGPGAAQPQAPGQPAGVQPQAPVQPATVQPQAGGTPVSGGNQGYNLSDTVRRELLLQYINSMIDLLFNSPGQ